MSAAYIMASPIRGKFRDVYQRQMYTRHLLSQFARKTLITWGNQGVEIVSLVACGVTPAGRHMLEAGGFTFLGKRKGRAIYELVVSQANTPLLKPYRAALAEYKANKNQENA